MESLRRYITDTELQDRGISAPSVFKTIQAEREIDSIIKNFYQGPFAPVILGTTNFTGAVFTTTSVTLPETHKSNFWDYSVLEITSGENKGELIFLTTSNGALIQFAESQTITAGTYDCKIYQEGKFPRDVDTVIQDDACYKSIPSWVKDCVAYQYLFRENNSQLFNQNYATKSYSVNRANYSEEYAVDAPIKTENRISPDVLTILEARGMLGTSI
jgi:hypothetical protein